VTFWQFSVVQTVLSERPLVRVRLSVHVPPREQSLVTFYTEKRDLFSLFAFRTDPRTFFLPGSENFSLSYLRES